MDVVEIAEKTKFYSILSESSKWITTKSILILLPPVARKWKL